MKKLIPEEALASATKLPKDNPILPLLSRVAKIDKVNELYDDICNEEGLGSVDRLFKT